MIFDFGLKTDNNFSVFKSLSVCLFQRRGPRDNIANSVILRKYLAL